MYATPNSNRRGRTRCNNTKERGNPHSSQDNRIEDTLIISHAAPKSNPYGAHQPRHQPFSSLDLRPFGEEDSVSIEVVDSESEAA